MFTDLGQSKEVLSGKKEKKFKRRKEERMIPNPSFQP